jgi:hypothetical protein
MRTYVVIWNNGASCFAHGPWASEETAERFVADTGVKLWRNLFPDEGHPIAGSNAFNGLLQERTGNKFFIIPVIPPGEQATPEDGIPCLFQQRT